MITASKGAMAVYGFHKDKLTPEEVLDLTLEEYHAPFREKYTEIG